MLIEAPRSFRFTSSDAERLAEELVGIRASARPLNGEFDQNFRLTSGGESYVLKIMRSGCDPEFVDLQRAALESLAHLPVPRSLRLATADDGQIVWLLNWLPGRLL